MRFTHLPASNGCHAEASDAFGKFLTEEFSYEHLGDWRPAIDAATGAAFIRAVDAYRAKMQQLQQQQARASNT